MSMKVKQSWRKMIDEVISFQWQIYATYLVCFVSQRILNENLARQITQLDTTFLDLNNFNST